MSDENYQNEVWKNVYQIIGFFMIIGFISTALCKKEPTNNKVKKNKL